MLNENERADEFPANRIQVTVPGSDPARGRRVLLLLIKCRVKVHANKNETADISEKNVGSRERSLSSNNCCILKKKTNRKTQYRNDVISK